MTTFAESHLGDMIHLRGILVRLLAHDKTWDLPLRLLDEPAPCGGPHCRALVCEALTPDGRRVHLHRLGSREIDVLEPDRGSELAAHEGEDLAETAKKSKPPAWKPWSSADDPEARAEQADFDDDTPNEEGDDEQ